jgi:WhiB family transcriptional regulator, redox-sensing transcriptional regulator
MVWAACRERPPPVTYPAWLDRAACRGMDANLFHPPHPSTARQITAKAKAICAGCPVKAECLEHFFDEPVGIYGGTSPHDRRQLRKARQGVAA